MNGATTRTHIHTRNTNIYSHTILSKLLSIHREVNFQPASTAEPVDGVEGVLGTCHKLITT